MTEINRIQKGGSLPGGPVLKKAKVENGNAIPPMSESPVALPPNVQVPPVASPADTSPNVRPPPQHHQFRRPADVFDSKLYQPTKLSEKVFIPIKDYPKVSTCILISTYTCRWV